jgi:hypothetical protein
MSQPVGATGFFHDLFAPLPEQGRKRKDLFDHVADYAETSEGAWDVMRFGNHVFAAIETTLSIPSGFADLITKAKGVFDSAGAAISIPRMIANLNALKGSVEQFFISQNLPYSDPLRDRKIAQAGKAGFVDSMALANTVAQAALFLVGATVFSLTAVQLCLLEAFYNATGGLLDGIEMVGEGVKLQQYQAPEAQPRNPAEATKLEEKKTLAWITIAKDVASIALAALTLAPLIAKSLGLVLVAPLVSPTAILAISAFWLAMKITSYFYNKLVVEASVTT